jgi:hypothetical protein
MKYKAGVVLSSFSINDDISGEPDTKSRQKRKSSSLDMDPFSLPLHDFNMIVL